MRKLEVAYDIKTIFKKSDKHLQSIKIERIGNSLSIEENDPPAIEIKVEPVLEIDIKTEIVEDKTENIENTENTEYLDPNEYGLSALQDILGGPDSSETESASEKNSAHKKLKKRQRKRKNKNHQDDFHSLDTVYEDPSKDQKKNSKVKKSDPDSDASSRRGKKVSDALKKFKCNVCKRLFLTKQHRKQHIGNVHAFNEKTHVCFMTDCRIAFESERQLKIHVDRVHLKVKQPFFCPDPTCDMRYTKKYVLKRHCLKMHNIVLCDERKKRNTDNKN